MFNTINQSITTLVFGMLLISFSSFATTALCHREYFYLIRQPHVVLALYGVCHFMPEIDLPWFRGIIGSASAAIFDVGFHFPICVSLGSPSLRLVLLF